jgi:MSHA pilin protein MshC
MLQLGVFKTSKPVRLNRILGFTIIELVTVILIVGIIAAVSFARLFDSEQLNGIMVRDRIIAAARTAQQNALGRADVELTITPNGGATEVTIATSDAGGTIQSFIVSLDSVSLSGDINNTDSCAITTGAASITSSNPMTLAFEELGDLTTSGVTGSTGTPTSALRICINDIINESICVSPSGFAYSGDCDT